MPRAQATSLGAGFKPVPWGNQSAVGTGRGGRAGSVVSEKWGGAMARDQMVKTIRGSRAAGLPKPSRQAEHGRTCSQKGCETKLSVYNRADKCWAHADTKLSPLRGRKPAAA